MVSGSYCLKTLSLLTPFIGFPDPEIALNIYDVDGKENND